MGAEAVDRVHSVGVERRHWFHGLQAVYEAYKPTLACLQCCLVVLAHAP